MSKISRAAALSFLSAFALISCGTASVTPTDTDLDGTDDVVEDGTMMEASSSSSSVMADDTVTDDGAMMAE